MMLLVLSLMNKCNGKEQVRHQVMCLTWREGEDKTIEERAQGTTGILGRADPNPDLER
jgi:hypothetical protein